VATPGKLVRAVADMLGAPEATVIQHDRNLVAAGLRSKGGRGLRQRPEIRAPQSDLWVRWSSSSRDGIRRP
jgi:hypothetical protein